MTTRKPPTWADRLPLLDVGRDWRRDFGHLVGGNPWLRKKLNRKRRIRNHADYLAKYVPEFEAMPPAYVLDLGPGAGELLEIARWYGHNAIGLDAESGKHGMGEPYVQACRLMHQRQRLAVLYCGIDGLLRTGDHRDAMIRSRAGRFCLINSRGSVEQMFHDCLHGPPHDEHHECHQLAWQDTDWTRNRLAAFFQTMEDLLQPGGVLLIHANGASNTADGDRLLQEAAAEAPWLECVRHEERLHKWILIKSSEPDSTASTQTLRTVFGREAESGKSLGCLPC